MPSSSGCLLPREVAFKPVARQPCDLVQRARLFEEVRRAGDNHQPLFTAQLRERRPVQLNDGQVVAADYQQGWRLDMRQGRSRQIGAPAPRDDRTHNLGTLCCRDQRRSGAGAGTEISDAERSAYPAAERANR